MLKESNGNVSLAELAVARRNEKRNAEIISEELVKVFITALDREDIEALSRALYRIPKTVEKFGERYAIMARRCKIPKPLPTSCATPRSSWKPKAPA